MSTFLPPPKARRGSLRLRLLGRMFIGCGVVVAAVAATIATGTLLEVRAFTDALKQNPQLQLGNELASANAGGPQTLLLIGSDKRAKGAADGGSPARSDTMLLVRLDPSQAQTTLLSVPRDLKVTIRPDHGRRTVQKINAAYSIGGAKLAVKTVKQVLGIRINHVIDINFGGFKALVNYLGCIFVQVDRRYYHSNLGLPASEQYSEIDIQPGYQKLCGDNALAYVRYRHADTDLVRSARQQDFLRQIKNQVGAGGLIARRTGIENIFGKFASTDIRSSDDVLKLLELAVQSAGHPVRQVTFTATLGPSYVTAGPGQVRRTVHEFLNGAATRAHVSLGAGRGAHPRGKTGAAVPLSPATPGEVSQARGLSHRFAFKLFYAVNRVTGAGALPDLIRPYRLHDHDAYVVVVAQGGLGQYYDLEGTSWQNPPILANPNQTLHLAGRTLRLYFEGQRLRVVAWRAGGGVYWLTNTLQDLLTNRQMLAIASSARPIS